MEINVRLNSKDVNTDGVFAALERLCQCFKSQENESCLTLRPVKEQNVQHDITPTPTEVTAAPLTNVPTVPTVPAVPVPAVGAAPTVPAAAPTVPTAVPQYTLEMISKAGTALIDAGKKTELLALLAKYGIEALTSLKPEYYGAFATELRAMGASI